MMYASFKAAGYFIGSSIIEADCKTVIGKRAKQSDMFWSVHGAQNVFNIRCSALSNTYDLYWLHRRELHKRHLRPAA